MKRSAIAQKGIDLDRAALLPLFLFGGGWTFVTLLMIDRFSKNEKGRKWLLLSTVSGILLSLGFPPLPFPFLMLLAFVGVKGAATWP